MAFSSSNSHNTSRAQLLVELATRNNNKNHEENLVSSDVFMSSSYDPTYPSTSGMNTNYDDYETSPKFYQNPATDTDDPVMLEELQEIRYQELFDSSSSPSDNVFSNRRFSDPVELQNEPMSFPKSYILNEFTGELTEQTHDFEENISDENYYLDENTGMFRLNNNDKEIDDYSPESDLSSDDEVTRKDRYFNKLKRLRGENYMGRKKQLDKQEGKIRYDLVTKSKKYLKGKPCGHSSIFKSDRSYLCGSVSEEKRKDIFTYFWSLHTWDAKKAYLKNLVKLRRVLRRREKKSDDDVYQRQLAYDYFLPNDENDIVKVCKSFLINTLNIHSETLTEWIKKLQDNNKEDKDLRSKHEKRKSKVVTSQPTVQFGYKADTVKEWLNFLNKVPSHYCRSSSNRVYVEDTFESKSHMYRVYTDWSKNNGKSSAGRKLFNHVLEEEKISIYKPRKDQCDICTAKKEGNISEEEYLLHISKKEEAYKAHTDATAMSSSEVLVLTIDVQSVLLCPKILVSVQYYKQKLQVHNFSIYSNNTKDVTLYVWHEGDGGVTANEFTTCIIDFLKTSLNFKKVIIISDGCSYQNRNKVLSSALAKLSKETGLEYEQIILEKGHTMMEVDSVHSTLEKKFRPPIYSPSDYISRMREARPKQPYHVRHVDYTFFKNYEENISLDSIRPGKKAGDPTVADIRALSYKDGTVYYKLRHPDDWQILPQRQRTTLRSSPNNLYDEPRKIDKTKYDSLQSLKPYMHRDYHSFYDNLQYK